MSDDRLDGSETGNGRDGRGRFRQGSRGGPGRPSRAAEQAYLDVAMGGVPLDAWRAIVDKAVLDAKGGDSKARDWLTRLLVPSPDAVDLAARMDDIRVRLESGERPASAS